MDLLVVRHAVAVEREQWAPEGRADSERPLTREGRRQMKRCAAALAKILRRVDVIASSPFVRAADTASLLAEAWPRAKLLHLDALASGGSQAELERWLAPREESRVVVVGHEPDLGRFVGRCLGGRGAAPMPLAKAGACLLRFDERPAAGKAELRWLLRPALLERLGGAKR